VNNLEVRVEPASQAENFALWSLMDAARIATFCDGRIIGGQMVALHRALHPHPESSGRGTSDADTAIQSELTVAESALAILDEVGYKPESGNRFRNGDRIIDILVGEPTTRFKMINLGDRQFDSAPGLHLALSSEPVVVRVTGSLLSGEELSFNAPLPSLEIAVCLKALAHKSRLIERDLTDLLDLLLIVEQELEKGEFEWRLGEKCAGVRRDAQRAMYGIANNLGRLRARTDENFWQVRLVALIRELVYKP